MPLTGNVSWATLASSAPRARPNSIVTPLARGTFEARPGPFNICLNPVTHSMVHDERHPLNPSVTTRLQAFDPNKLHWQVRLQGSSVTSKAIVRNWTVKRTKAAFVNELQRLGYDRNGRSVDSSGSGAFQHKPMQSRPGLKGALLITVKASVANTPFDQVEASCRTLAESVVKMQRPNDASRRHNASTTRRWGSHYRHVGD